MCMLSKEGMQIYHGSFFKYKSLKWLCGNDRAAISGSVFVHRQVVNCTWDHCVDAHIWSSIHYYTAVMIINLSAIWLKKLMAPCFPQETYSKITNHTFILTS